MDIQQSKEILTFQEQMTQIDKQITPDERTKMVDDTFKESGVTCLLDYLNNHPLFQQFESLKNMEYSEEHDKQLTIDARDRFVKLDEMLNAMEPGDSDWKFSH